MVNFYQETMYAKLNAYLSDNTEFRRLWNSLSLILGRVSSSGLGFITTLLTARLYAPAEVGISSGIVSAMMLCVQIALLGVGSAVISVYPQHKEQPRKVINTGLNLIILASLLAALAFLVLSSVAFHELAIVSRSMSYTLMFFGITLFGTVNVYLDHVSIVLRRSSQVLTRNVLFGLVTIAGVPLIPFITGQQTSMSIILAWVLAGLVACVVGIFQLFRALDGYSYRLELDSSLAKELIGIGLPNYLLTLTERAPNWIMPIMVTELLSPTDNAIWYNVWMMAWVVFIIPISVGQNLFADVAHDPNALRAALRHANRTSIALGTLAAIVTIALAWVILLLLGPTYANAGTVPLRILVLAVYPVIFIQSYYAVCRGRRTLTEAIITGLVSGTVSLTAAVTIGLKFGLTGMATTWLITQFAAGGWTLFRLRTLSGENKF
jgi:O-antigen/teichoic acid export membrane protein